MRRPRVELGRGEGFLRAGLGLLAGPLGLTLLAEASGEPATALAEALANGGATLATGGVTGVSVVRQARQARLVPVRARVAAARPGRREQWGSR